MGKFFDFLAVNTFLLFVSECFTLPDIIRHEHESLTSANENLVFRTSYGREDREKEGIRVAEM